MRDAIVSVAEYWGVPYLDLKGDGQRALELRQAAFRVSETDGAVNVQGQEWYSTVIENFMRGL